MACGFGVNINSGILRAFKKIVGDPQRVDLGGHHGWEGLSTPFTSGRDTSLEDSIQCSEMDEVFLGASTSHFRNATFQHDVCGDFSSITATYSLKRLEC